MKEAYAALQALQAKFIPIQDQIEKEKEAKDKVFAQLKKSQAECDKLNKTKDIINSAIEKIKKPNDAIDSTLSCLSCLNYLTKDKAQTLICGHSICAECFSKHSDPNSKDSLVFCEECKIETKNKDLQKDSKFIKSLTSRFTHSKQCVESIKKAIEA